MSKEPAIVAGKIHRANLEGKRSKMEIWCAFGDAYAERLEKLRVGQRERGGLRARLVLST